MTEDSHPSDDDGTPWASPEITANYEAALGRFILAFNQVDIVANRPDRLPTKHGGNGLNERRIVLGSTSTRQDLPDRVARFKEYASAHLSGS